MKSILKELSQRVQSAMRAAGLDGDPLVRASQDAKFGDYQSNCAMGIAKRIGQKPRDVAQTIIEKLDIADMCDPPEIAGPGFINLRLTAEFVAGRLGCIPGVVAAAPDRLGIDPVENTQTIVIDFSSPNLAKEMHVGHLRTTVIGESIARLLEFEGHTVHRENHVGDWGTQFGMLVAHLRRVRPEVVENPGELMIKDLESFYVQAKARFDADEDFKKESRETVVALQQGDPNTRRIWKAFCDESLRHCHAIYKRLDVTLVDRGESYYADGMKEVVRRVEAAKKGGADFVQVSDGALCLFLDGFKTRDGDPLPVIVRKSDGGFNYTTSDLATIIHRVETLKADRVIYVVGVAQKQHFNMLFAAAKKLNFISDRHDLEHLAFGNMLSPAGTPFKTRDGGTVKLKDLLGEAVARALSTVKQQASGGGRHEWTDQQISDTAETVGIGAVKYFDLCHALQSDYKFNVDTMCSLEGNTAPYMLYAYARIRSIAEKAGVDFETLDTSAPLVIHHDAEIALGKKLLQFADTLEGVSRELRPNILTDYLYDLAKAFSRFYDKKLGVRVIDATPEEVRNSRLRLCHLTARTLQLGLHLLGIGTVEQM